jgi:phosphoribosylamine--glycine ligase
MRVLLVGSGGREDALAWALGRSPRLTLLRCAPGNAGIARRAELVPIPSDDVAALADHARRERYDLVVIGPEAPLVAGLADRLREAGIAVFGPSAAAAQLEGSKVFAKRFMERHAIPTAPFRLFADAGEARRFLESGEATYPLVLKADGLAGGKGVLLAGDRGSAIEASEAMLRHGRFGEAGARIVIEECLQGREASFFVLSDGERFVELGTCQDYKRAHDADRGPNTGGMGTYAPSAFLDDAARSEVLASIVAPTLRGMAAEERPYRGVLYVGLMLTAQGPRVLEYNARFGDPETQVLVPRLEGDWLELLARCATGRLDGQPAPRFRRGAVVCVVLASAGYPDGGPRGCVIEGLDDAAALADVELFHAGTARDDHGRWVTAGGRVLGVTAVGSSLAGARDRAYEAVSRIRWEGRQCRTDIALDALARA